MRNTNFFKLWLPRYDKVESRITKRTLLLLLHLFKQVKLGKWKFLSRLKVGYENCTMEFHNNVWKKKEIVKLSKVEKCTFFRQSWVLIESFFPNCYFCHILFLPIFNWGFHARKVLSVLSFLQTLMIGVPSFMTFQISTILD